MGPLILLTKGQLSQYKLGTNQVLVLHPIPPIKVKVMEMETNHLNLSEMMCC